MARWIAAVLVASLPAMMSTASLGQQAPEQEFASPREHWQQRVDDARRQSEGFVASIRVLGSGAAPSSQNPLDPNAAREELPQRMENARQQPEQFDAPLAPAAASTNDDFADSALTREQWFERIENARRRSEEFVAKARVQPMDPLPRDFAQREASERVMNDPSLQPGDIVSTDKGLFVFVGRDEERKPGDFRAAVPAPQ